jgi:diguanylate cyclase (GGDEF)-like protein
MKVTGARNEPLPGVRRTAAASASAPVGGPARADSTSFLGVPAVEMTPAVLAAIQTLLKDLDALREEVGQLKGRLKSAEEIADRDTLTPLLNRRGFLREFSRVRTFAERYGSSASLVYFDLDGFKAINDQYGHAAGDAALRTVSERLLTHVRESDVVGRMGGDEFAVVLVQTDLATAESKAASLAAAIEGEPVVFAAGSATIRLSYGVREIVSNTEPEALIAEADAAMFAAKRRRKTG